MLVGYTRVSTENQNLDMQIQALKKLGCEKIFPEKMALLQIGIKGKLIVRRLKYIS